ERFVRHADGRGAARPRRRPRHRQPRRPRDEQRARRSPDAARDERRHHGADELRGRRREQGPRRPAHPALNTNKESVMRSLRPFRLLAGLALCLPIGALADAELVESQCAECHALTRPDYDALGIAERAERKGPSRFYAGNKYREEWLVEWLQRPERIWPGGVFAPAHAISTPEGDVIDEASLPEHPALSAA